MTYQVNSSGLWVRRSRALKAADAFWRTRQVSAPFARLRDGDPRDGLPAARKRLAARVFLAPVRLAPLRELAQGRLLKSCPDTKARAADWETSGIAEVDGGSAGGDVLSIAERGEAKGGEDTPRTERGVGAADFLCDDGH